jgi:hypothetical protein
VPCRACTSPLKEVTDVRLPITRPRPDQRPRRKAYDHNRIVAARERAFLDAARYRITL